MAKMLVMVRSAPFARVSHHAGCRSGPELRAPAGDFRERGADFGATVAAVVDQETQQVGHVGDFGGVDDRASLAPGPHQPGMAEHGKAGRKGIGQYAQPPTHLARRQTSGTGLDEQAKNHQSALMGEGGQGDDGARRIHSS